MGLIHAHDVQLLFTTCFVLVPARCNAFHGAQTRNSSKKCVIKEVGGHFYGSIWE